MKQGTLKCSDRSALSVWPCPTMILVVLAERHVSVENHCIANYCHHVRIIGFNVNSNALLSSCAHFSRFCYIANIFVEFLPNFYCYRHSLRSKFCYHFFAGYKEYFYITKNCNFLNYFNCINNVSTMFTHIENTVFHHRSHLAQCLPQEYSPHEAISHKHT